MTEEDDKKKQQPTDLGTYRESPPGAPLPAPVQLTEYEKNLQVEADAAAFQRQLRHGIPKQRGCLQIGLMILAGIGILLVLLVGLVLFTCSR